MNKQASSVDRHIQYLAERECSSTAGLPRHAAAARVCSRLMIRKLRAAIAAAALIALLAATIASGQSYHIDQSTSANLTRYLHQHRLPLVGAQVLRTDDGNPKLLLYGFVATEFGKRDAQKKATQFLGVPGIPVVNSMQVNPSIAHKPGSGASPLSPGSGSEETNPNGQWNRAMEGIYKNGAQPLPSPSYSP